MGESKPTSEHGSQIEITCLDVVKNDSIVINFMQLTRAESSVLYNSITAITNHITYFGINYWGGGDLDSDSPIKMTGVLVVLFPGQNLSIGTIYGVKI